MNRRLLSFVSLFLVLALPSAVAPPQVHPLAAQTSQTDPPRSVQAETTTRVSVASDGTQANNRSHDPSLSTDGRYVAFHSYASNLAAGDTNACSDIFVHDRQTGQTARVSVASDGTQGNAGSYEPSVSGDGRYVAFSSTASNLVAGDTNGKSDVFVHDGQTGETVCVSVASDGTQGNSSSYWASLSANGRYAAFVSYSNNLVADDTNDRYDVFVHDRQMGQTMRVSVATDGTQGNSDSSRSSLSADGRYVAFGSLASNLVADDTNGEHDVFVHDRQTGQTERVSVASDGTQGNAGSLRPSVSADGRYVAFVSHASNLVAGDTNGCMDVFVHDRQTGQTERVSLASDGTQGNADSECTSLSADGRYVAIASWASNLVAGDTNRWNDVFVHDRQTGETTRVSVASDGTQGNSNSWCPFSLSVDGRYAVFWSDASNLVVEDTNGVSDVFVHDRGFVEPTYAISGRVTGTDDQGVPDVTVSAGDGRSTVTDTNGDYDIADLPTGTYTVTPYKIGYTFSPASRTVAVPPDATDQDFVGYDSPPIVFVHGWGGLPPWGPCQWPEPDDYFQSADNDLAAHYYVGYAQLETSPCYTPPLVDNVPRLETAIAQAKAATGQDKVILIAHSMGGIVSRAYMEGPDYEQDVEALFTFGSPHQGVPEDLIVFLANGVSLGDYCEEYQPAACEFSVLGMQLFNREYPTRTTDVTYHVISGDAPFWPRTALAMAADKLLTGGDDGAVLTSSGIGLDGTLDRWTTDEVHGPSSGPRSYFIRDGGQSTSYTECLKPVLIDGTADVCGDIGTLGTRAVAAPVASQHTPFVFGTLLSGETATQVVSLEGGPTLFASQWQTETVEFTLVDPSDQVIDPAYAASHPELVTYAADATSAVYEVLNADAGVWEMVLSASSVPVDGSSYTMFAAFDSDLQLTADTNQAWYQPGSAATITAALSDPAANAEIAAAVLYADGATQELDLSPQGAGQYEGTYIVHDAPGYAEVRIAAAGTTAGGTPMERGLVVAFQVSPSSATLSGTYGDFPEPRSPGSPYYKALVVTVGINATIEGTLGLSADLQDTDGHHVAHSLTLTDVIPGSDTLELRFDGDEIYASEQDGPYTLTNLLLTDRRGSTLVVLEKENVYTTGYYDYRSFGMAKVYLPLILRNH